MEKPKSWVYFLQSGERGAVKIGFTGSAPMVRLSALQTGNPEPLRLLGAVPGVREDETALHERFARFRIGGEWFRPEPELLSFIDGVLMGCREQPKSYDDMFAWDDWLDTIAQYCAVWKAASTIEDMEIGDTFAEREGYYLPATDLASLNESNGVLALAMMSGWEGGRLFGHDRIRNRAGRARTVLNRQPRERGLTPDEFADLRVYEGVSRWLAMCSMVTAELQALQPVPVPLDARMRERVLDVWMNGVEIVSAVLSPGDDHGRRVTRAAYIGICGGADTHRQADALREMLRLLRASGCYPPRTEIPEWVEAACTDESANAEAN